MNMREFVLEEFKKLNNRLAALENKINEEKWLDEPAPGKKISLEKEPVIQLRKVVRKPRQFSDQELNSIHDAWHKLRPDFPNETVYQMAARIKRLLCSGRDPNSITGRLLWMGARDVGKKPWTMPICQKPVAQNLILKVK